MISYLVCVNFLPKKSVLLFCWLFLFHFAAFAQTPDQPGGYRHITVRDGLPSSEVYNVFQDRLGYIWMCTDAGVCRYNGYGFQSFTTREGLTDNTVFRMSEDENGKIWAQGFSGGLSYFDGKKFQPIPANDSLIIIYANGQKNSFCMEPGKDGGITVGGLFTHGVFHVGPEDHFQSLHKIRPAGIGDSLEMIWSAKRNGKEYYAAMSRNGNNGIIFHDGITTFIEFDSNQGAPTNNQCYLLHDGRILVSFFNRLYLIGLHGEISITEFPKSIVNMMEDPSGNVWICLFFGGAYMLPAADLSAEKKVYLEGKTISSVFEDNEQGYWFSTVGDGVYYLPDIRFGYLTPSEGLAEPNIQSLGAYQKHRMIIGLPNGVVSLLDPELKGAGRLITSVPAIKITLPTESVFSTNDSIILCASGISIRDSMLRQKGLVIEGAHFKGVTKDPRTGNLVYFSPSSLTFVSRKLKQDSSIQTKVRYTAACYGKDGTIWLGGLNGLWKLKGRQPVYLGDSAFGVKARIDGICEDKNGVIWVATRGEGVFAISGKQKFHFGEAEGMAANTCRAITLDPSGGIWVGTNHGVTFLEHFDPKTKTADLRSFNSSHGLLSDEVKFILCHDGKLWMGSNEGLCWISIDALVKDSVPPPVYITRVLFGSKECRLDSLESFDYSDQTIRIFVEGLCFRNPQGIRYKYRMIGGDEDWITTANREISFSGLAPGDYRLEIIAVNSDGHESNHPAVFSFQILAPFYRTPWFLGLMTALAIAVIYLSINFVLKRKQKISREKADTEKRIAELRLSALRAQMNPHFIFNAINSIQHFVLQNNSEQAYNYLAKFSRLIRLVLDQSQSESISLDQELKMLNLYIELEQLRFERPFSYEIIVDEELADNNIKVPGMLVQPFVENAIWHGLLPKKTGEAWIRIEFRRQKGFTEITIEDNGVGRKAAEKLRPKDEKRRSYGLQITEERLRISEEKSPDQPVIQITDMHNENGDATGTKVVIQLNSANDDDD
jgi:ligand-binding sensor domain-containing protein/anti-sigma regulatory factor (Ser/Thr protein kinase)